MKFASLHHQSISNVLENSKFVIDGEIEGKQESVYLKKQKSIESTKLRVKFFGLGFVCLLLFLSTIFLLYTMDRTNSKLLSMKQRVKMADHLIQENKNFGLANGLLQKKIIQLKKENDILSENHDSAKGVFFEVQIGNFYDFNIDAYMNELESLRQEKKGNTSKLILGRFRSFQKAMLFENDIKKMGFTNAFLVGRIDGQLVDYQKALIAHQNTTHKEEK